MSQKGKWKSNLGFVLAALVLLTGLGMWTASGMHGEVQINDLFPTPVESMLE